MGLLLGWGAGELCPKDSSGNNWCHPVSLWEDELEDSGINVFSFDTH